MVENISRAEEQIQDWYNICKLWFLNLAPKDVFRYLELVLQDKLQSTWSTEALQHELQTYTNSLKSSVYTTQVPVQYSAPKETPPDLKRMWIPQIALTCRAWEKVGVTANQTGPFPELPRQDNTESASTWAWSFTLTVLGLSDVSYGTLLPKGKVIQLRGKKKRK